MNVVLVSPSMLFFSLSQSLLRMDGEIVHVNGHPPLSNLSMEDHVHHHLEGSGGIGQPEEYDRWFEEAFWGEECHFPFVSLLNVNVVVSPTYIEFGEEGAASEAVNGLGDKGRHVPILLGPSVDGSVVLDWVELSVFLFDEEEVGGIRAP